MAEEINNQDNLLPEVDLDFLKEKDFSYELQNEGNRILLIIKDYSLPDKFNPQKADLLVLIPSGYPNTPLDMFWTIPDIKLLNGNWPQAADQHETYGGRSWQRWSRHGQWRAGIDTLKSFLTAVKNEINKGY